MLVYVKQKSSYPETFLTVMPRSGAWQWCSLVTCFLEARPALQARERTAVATVTFARDRFRARASKSCNSKRLSVTPCPGSGSFARCFPSFSPYCRTSSVGGGRSTVSRFLPEPLNPSPGRSVGPGFLARRMGSKRCVCTFLCELVRGCF